VTRLVGVIAAVAAGRLWRSDRPFRAHTGIHRNPIGQTYMYGQDWATTVAMRPPQSLMECVE